MAIIGTVGRAVGRRLVKVGGLPYGLYREFGATIMAPVLKKRYRGEALDVAKAIERRQFTKRHFQLGRLMRAAAQGKPEAIAQLNALRRQWGKPPISEKWLSRKLLGLGGHVVGGSRQARMAIGGGMTGLGAYGLYRVAKPKGQSVDYV